MTRSLCNKCNKNLRTLKHTKPDGTKVYRGKCYTCFNKYKIKGYAKFKRSKCEFCGFVPLHSCQLDVDHIDGNHSNNKPDNLQTLCANCHRLKTFIHKDWEV